MKEISFEEFKASVPKVIDEILFIGEMFRVDCGNNAVVIMEEPEFELLRQSFKTLLNLGLYVKDGDK